jgi:lysophospholipase L1-like esterase
VLRSHAGLLAVGLLLQIGLGLVVARTWLGTRNTLHANGRWHSTKTDMAYGLMGAYSFLTSRQPLAGGHLNLAAWHGFQEVFLDRPLDPQSLRFRFLLSRGGYLSVLFNRVEGRGYGGFRLGSSGSHPSIAFEADDRGRFLRERPLRTATLPPDTWRQAEVRFAGGEASLTIDGRALGSLRPADWRSPQQVGFRGSRRTVAVDDIVVRRHDGGVVRETFSGPRGALLVTCLVPAGLVLVNALVFLGLARWTGRPIAELGMTFAMVNMTLLLMAALLLGFVRWRAPRYPVVDELLAQEEAQSRHGRGRRIVRQIRRQYGVPAAPSAYRVLLVGSSQTWGAGARRAEETLVRILERRLQAWGPPDVDFQCIAGAVPAARAQNLQPVLEREWLGLGPRLVVINLGNNDSDHDRFLGPLERMVEASLEAGSRPVLVLEANSPEMPNTGLRRRHRAMQEMGDRLAVPVVDLHGRLRALEGTGFVWWDKVHLTSYGQELAAGLLFDALKPWIERDLAAGS